MSGGIEIFGAGRADEPSVRRHLGPHQATHGDIDLRHSAAARAMVVREHSDLFTDSPDELRDEVGACLICRLDVGPRLSRLLLTCRHGVQPAPRKAYGRDRSEEGGGETTIIHAQTLPKRAVEARVSQAHTQQSANRCARGTAGNNQFACS